jgi:hypothetical protein
VVFVVGRYKTQWLKPGAGEPFSDLDGGPEMVVPAGSFAVKSRFRASMPTRSAPTLP